MNRFKNVNWFYLIIGVFILSVGLVMPLHIGEGNYVSVFILSALVIWDLYLLAKIPKSKSQDNIEWEIDITIPRKKGNK